MIYYKKSILGLLFSLNLLRAADTTRELVVCSGFFKALESTTAQDLNFLKQNSKAWVTSLEEGGVYIQDLTMVAEHCASLTEVSMSAILNGLKRSDEHNGLALKFYRGSASWPCRAHLIGESDITKALNYLNDTEKTAAQQLFEDFLIDQKEKCDRIKPHMS